MHRTFIACLLFLGVTDAPSASMDDVDFTSVVCLNDTSGRVVKFYTPDTSLTVGDVVKVVLKTGGYEVTTKKGQVRFFIKPPFRSIDISPAADEGDETGEERGKRPKRRARKTKERGK